jgi:hypothetical protein
MNYPNDIKAFYMRLNDDGRTVAAMDVLTPGIGEIIGGQPARGVARGAGREHGGVPRRLGALRLVSGSAPLRHVAAWGLRPRLRAHPCLRHRPLVSLVYTEDGRWRNRAEFMNGRPEIVAFLTRKWNKDGHCIGTGGAESERTRSNDPKRRPCATKAGAPPGICVASAEVARLDRMHRHGNAFHLLARARLRRSTWTHTWRRSLATCRARN